MGKPTTTTRKKNQVTSKSSHGNSKQGKSLERSVSFDDDTAVFIDMSKELKEEGNKLFQKRNFEEAILKYEKAIKLLPANHIDVAYLHNNTASCYMQMGIGEFPRAVKECNLALEVAPKYTKAMLRRARCYEALGRFDLSMKDVNTVLGMEPNNSNALELADRLRKSVEENGVLFKGEEIFASTPGDFLDPSTKVVKEKPRKKKSSKVELSSIEETEEKKLSDEEEKILEDKVVVEEKRSVKEENLIIRAVKLIHGEDIRWAQLPVNCSIRLVRDVVVDRFPSMNGVLIKYKDQEGDLVTITTTDELRIAEGLNDGETPLRLYIAEVSLDKEPLYEGNDTEERNLKPSSKSSLAKTAVGDTCVEDWIIHFALLFKNHVGFECDSYLDLHEIGMKLYSEAMEDTITGEDAQELFDIAMSKFQEMTALGLFNWGNVHLSKARKRVSPGDDTSAEFTPVSIAAAYDWAQKEYTKAGTRYDEALRLKPDFPEGLLALGLLKFEQAKLLWYRISGEKSNNIDIQQSSEVLELYNKAEDSIERGMELWEELEEQRLNGLSKFEKDKTGLSKFGLDGLIHIPGEDASKQATNTRSQIYMLWGTILYERSVAEYQLSLPTWQECLEVAVEKFQLAGASQTDIAVMIKNHCSNETALEGFKVNEIVQAWNDMYDIDRWRTNVSNSRLEPLFRRRPLKLLTALEHL